MQKGTSGQYPLTVALRSRRLRNGTLVRPMSEHRAVRHRGLPNLISRVTDAVLNCGNGRTGRSIRLLRRYYVDLAIDEFR